jgi:hypothetical protein
MKKNLVLWVIAVCIGTVLVNAQDLEPNPSVFPVAERDNTYVQNDKISPSRNSSHIQKAPWTLPLFHTGSMEIRLPISINDGDSEMSTFYLGIDETWNTGPFFVRAEAYLPAPVRFKTAIYVPKPDFLDTSNKRLYLQGFNECPYGEIDYRNFQKVYEFPEIIDMQKAEDLFDGQEYYEGNFHANWDAMTDPQFTGGVSYPVYDCVSVVVENADTGEILSNYGSRNINRYFTSLQNSVKYTRLEHSVKADIYFASKLPITNVTAYLVDDFCTMGNVKWTDFQVSGEQALTGYAGQSLAPYLKAYQVFDDPAQYLEDEEIGLYHLTWELIGTDGKPYDPVTLRKHYLGLIIEGEGVAINMTGKDGYIMNLDTSHWGDVPRPLSATGITTPTQSDNIKIAALSNSLVIDTGNSPVGGTCRVYTTNGAEVMQQALTQPVTQIGRFAIGTYIVEVQAGTETKTEKVFICGCIR